MSPKLKSGILLTSTLLIGILIGFLLKTIIIESKFEKFNKMRGKDGFRIMLQETVAPSSEQMEQLAPILEKYHQKFETARIEAGKFFEAIRDSIDNDLSTVLTSEQMVKLREEFTKKGFDHDRMDRKPAHENKDDL